MKQSHCYWTGELQPGKELGQYKSVSRGNLIEAVLKNSSDAKTPLSWKTISGSNTDSGTSSIFMTHFQKGSTFSPDWCWDQLSDVFNCVQPKRWKHLIKSWNRSRPLVFLTELIPTSEWWWRMAEAVLSLSILEKEGPVQYTLVLLVDSVSYVSSTGFSSLASVTFSLFCCSVTNESGCCCYRTSPWLWWHNASAYDQHKAHFAPKRFPTLVLRPTACVTYSKMLVVTGGWLSMWSGASFQNTTHSSTGTRAALLILADYPPSLCLALSLAACGDHLRHTVDPHQLTTNLSLQLWGFSAVLLFVHVHSAVIFRLLLAGCWKSFLLLSLISFMHSFPSLFSPTLPTSRQTLCWHQTVRRIIWVITGLLLTCVSCKNPDLQVVPHFSVPQLVSKVQTRHEEALLFRCGAWKMLWHNLKSAPRAADRWGVWEICCRAVTSPVTHEWCKLKAKAALTSDWALLCIFSRSQKTALLTVW